MNAKPNIPPYLLWEYDLETFNYVKSYKIVIERILIMDTISDWIEMLKFYPIEEINETIDWSKQVEKWKGNMEQTDDILVMGFKV